MNILIEKSLLKESFEFNSSISELREQIRLKKNREFNLEWISNDEFKVSSKISIGTIILNYNPSFFNGIKGYAKLTESNKGKTKIELSTKIRVEMYFIGITSILFPLIFFFSKENLPIWLLFIFPLAMIWFWSVYRFQEKRLFEKVKDYIKNEL